MDLAGATPMVPGGVGFSLNAFRTVVTAELASSLSLRAEVELDQSAQRDLANLRSRLEKVLNGKGALVKVLATAPQHVGLGSKTTLLLSIVAAVDALHRLAMPRETIQQLTDRGGTSGIGIHSFFSGGLVVDVGRRRNSIWVPSPSSANSGHEIPLQLLSCRFPADWRIVLLKPDVAPLDGDAERSFFKRACPIPKLDALEALAQVYHGVIPSVLRRDIGMLRSSLASISQTGFKRREIEIYDVAVRNLISQLNDAGIACGMSSLGPTVYAIVEAADKRALEKLRQIARETGASLEGPFEAPNNGADTQVASV